MADKKANQGTTITPEARVSNNIVRVSNEDGTAGNGLKIALTDFSLRDIQTTRNACIALLASSGSAITTGQGYVFDGLDGAIPTGISLIRVRGINTGGAVKAFSPNAEALVTALGVYVPCSYNVATNVVHYTLTATLLFTGFASSGSYEVLENNLGVTFGTLAFGGDVWVIPLSASIANISDNKYVDVNVGTSRNQLFISVTPYAYYDGSGPKIYISAIDATSAYSDELWAATPIKITITAQY